MAAFAFHPYQQHHQGKHWDILELKFLSLRKKNWVKSRAEPFLAFAGSEQDLFGGERSLQLWTPSFSAVT